jgi:potassium-transporting ATPase KdpC subunit
MFKQIRAAFVLLLLLTILTGVVYPLVVTGIAQLIFSRQANGSLIQDKNGQAIGSTLIGQPFDDPKYFWGRLSATTPVPYAPYFKDDAGNLTGSTGSNYGPLNPALIGETLPDGTRRPGAVEMRIKTLRDADAALGIHSPGPVPVDLATASGSGLDPDISPAAAEYQVLRVAKARGMKEEAVRDLVKKNTQARTLGFLGEPRVNVLQLNLALDGLPR